ncbi:hypothetical protein IOQ59_04385 [Pontibacterium sp. N1Y112]|mgnify:CR=1 FL=1|jgi:hypothetical protein|uniref:Uncharacterized protein n=1 Tax=Pontibacterium sinense TaxID=2781979 RepID=A0A8J7FSH6_9GAMM|nr:hypothetical protein [Pontibacterium sinense]MBE9396495.1 hypothetical protein [Pontibacterium sinense]MCO4757452.1 hypothetical protein [Oceanospirillaceae bacterium]
MNVTNALQSGVIGQNRTMDNVAKASGDLHGSGKSDHAEEATGREPASVSAVKDTTVQEAEAATTKVVTPTSETVGGNINIHV